MAADGRPIPGVDAERPMTRHESFDTLRLLEERVRADLELTNYPSRPWLPAILAPDGRPASDVIVIGGGQSGISAAFGLMREQLQRVRVVDRAIEGYEGPWATFARMTTLRTPKHVLGPDLGMPSLTVGAWYSARFGADAWRDLKRVPRLAWMEYLRWLRRVLAIPIENGVTLEGFGPCAADPRLLEITLRHSDRLETAYARRLVLATGIDGSGAWAVPPVLGGLPRERWFHTSDAIDFDRLKGLRIGILGAGASAFDNAGTALEAGAASVDLFYRRARLPRVNPYRWMENAGFLAHFADMPDVWKWRFYCRMTDNNQPPPQDTFERCTTHTAFRLHPGEPWRAVADEGAAIRVETDHAVHRFDRIIVATGLDYDLALRPELSAHTPHIATWADRLPEAAASDNVQLRRMPYLGPGYEFTPRVPGTAEWLGRVTNFTFGAQLSLGPSAAALSGFKYGVRRLVDGIVGGLWAEELPGMYADFAAFADPELTAPDTV